MNSQTTDQILIEVKPEFVPEESDPENQYYFFEYFVSISNLGQDPVQLTHRHWIITDARGKVEEVRGPGVVGQQPKILPGETFQYTSFCPLRTSIGTMRGSYEMIRKDGTRFHAEIPEFELSEEGREIVYH